MIRAAVHTFRKQHHILNRPLLLFSRTSPTDANHSPPHPLCHPSKPTRHSTPSHNTLPTFLAHAARTSLSPTSTLYLGTHYEYTVLHSLSRLGLSLTRTGGVSDRGIDLLGHWFLPTLPCDRPLRVIVQCKALKGRGKVGPAVVRELEGAFAGVPKRFRDRDAGDGKDETSSAKPQEEEQQEDLPTEVHDTSPLTRESTSCLGLLAAPTEATKGVRDAMGRSRWPMVYIKAGIDGRVEQLLWNRKAAEQGLEGVGVVVRHMPPAATRSDEATRWKEGEPVSRSVPEDEEGRILSEVVLMWKGEAWECTEEQVRKWDAEIGR